ncbi:MAG TPA: class I SAM-dependent methyltransferase [Flavitalea sp.]|nr:class I SAM-dependent methyltransferase [Flavitalea sp.]
MISYQRCPVCDSSGIQQALTATDHTVTLEKFSIWQCANCSLRFTQDVPDANEIAKYYKSENYISHSETDKGIINWLYLQVRKYTLSSKRNFICNETGIKKGILLDIGAGAGAFVHHMKFHGWKVNGVEPDTTAIERASSEYGIQLLPAASLFSLQGQLYDAITMWHVLEHVHDLHAYISHIKSICKTGGKIFIAVPNYTSYDAIHYESTWAAYDVPRHLFHFSPASMQELMKKHGCVIEKIQPMWFDSFYVSLLSERYKTGHPNLLKGFWNGLRSNMKAASKFRRASSIIYVIRVGGQLPA